MTHPQKTLILFPVMKYQMQIRIEDPQNPTKKVWVSIKASHLKTPYEYETKEEAERMLRICYGGTVLKEDQRILEVK